MNIRLFRPDSPRNSGVPDYHLDGIPTEKLDAAETLRGFKTAPPGADLIPWRPALIILEQMILQVSWQAITRVISADLPGW